jgi:ribonucleoside-diphosphate reductase beta chain
MEGSAKIISLIARDESQHLVLTQQIIKAWQNGDDEEMVDIAAEEKPNIINMFKNAVEEEKAWAEYLFKDGSMIGLNEKLLSQYVEFTANRRLRALGFDPLYDIGIRNNPLPWTQYWLNSKGQQNAPQETEIESYVVGGIKQDVQQDTFSGFKL